MKNLAHCVEVCVLYIVFWEYTSQQTSRPNLQPNQRFITIMNLKLSSSSRVLYWKKDAKMWKSDHPVLTLLFWLNLFEDALLFSNRVPTCFDRNKILLINNFRSFFSCCSRQPPETASGELCTTQQSLYVQDVSINAPANYGEQHPFKWCLLLPATLVVSE